MPTQGLCFLSPPILHLRLQFLCNQHTHSYVFFHSRLTSTLTVAFSIVIIRLATKASRPLACGSPLEIGLKQGNGPKIVDVVGVLAQPFGDGPAHGDTADHAVASLEMIEPFEVAFGLGGNVGAVETEDVTVAQLPPLRDTVQSKKKLEMRGGWRGWEEEDPKGKCKACILCGRDTI
ncbi:hypothetical protein JB92DRAFT_3099920 [Gautieria morchelliformis]|nr:hypothetical protein JB92DRAFT_3099920 [Gautieria morchelliformis]